MIRIFRGFMAEFTPAHLKREFDAYVETAVREELSRIPAYYLGKAGQGFWVAEVDGAVVGMIGVERHSGTEAELRRMAVDSAYRRRGIGRELLLTAERFCLQQGCRTIALSTAEFQVAAIRLYEKHGYQRVRTEIAQTRSHKTVGAGVTRHHYEKRLN